MPEGAGTPWFIIWYCNTSIKNTFFIFISRYVLPPLTVTKNPCQNHIKFLIEKNSETFFSHRPYFWFFRLSQSPLSLSVHARRNDPLCDVLLSLSENLSFRFELIPRGEESATRILPLHFFRSPVDLCSFFNRKDFMSCCIISPHRFLCRPRLRRPLTFTFHGVFVLSSHQMTVPSQSGLSYYVSNAWHLQRLSDDLIPFLMLP